MSDQPEKPSEAVEVLDRQVVFEDFFKVNSVELTHPLPEGGRSKPARFLVFERGDSAAVLLWNRAAGHVVLIRQFRAPTLGKTVDKGFDVQDGAPVGDGWMIEAVAGMVRPGEDPLDCVIRETEEETGYVLDRSQAEKVGVFFPSPGGTSERIHVFLAEVSGAERRGRGGGLKALGEHVYAVDVSIADFLSWVERGDIQDAKTLVAAQVLQQRLNVILGEGKKPAEAETRVFRYVDVDGFEHLIGFKSGDVQGIHDVDVWVNSENTDMEMDRFTGRSVSANIRQLGARWDSAKNVVEDTIAAALRRELGALPSVQIGHVLATTPGQLSRRPHHVKKLLHLAAVKGRIGQGMSAKVNDLELCVCNVLDRACRNNHRLLARYFKFLKWRSLLLPMIGTGSGGVPGETAAPALIDAVLSYFKRNPGAPTPAVYLNPFTRHLTELVARDLERRAELAEIPAEEAAAAEPAAPHPV